MDESKGSKGRDETRAERYDRNLSELLQELRVAGIGVQVLFGFLLSLPFTDRFSVLDRPERRLYAGTLVVAALAVAFLVAPVAYHRLVFRRRLKRRLLRFAQWTALFGLACAAVAIGGASTLVLIVVLDGVVVPVVVGGLIGVYALLWLVIPLRAREDGDPTAPRLEDRLEHEDRLEEPALLEDHGDRDDRREDVRLRR